MEKIKQKIKRIRWFKQVDDFTITCAHRTHGEPPMLADKGLFNLGKVTLWLCMNCTARVREQIVTGMLTDAAAKQFHVDGDLQAMIKENTKALNEMRKGYER